MGIIRQVTLFFTGADRWFYPQIDGDSIAYYPSSSNLPGAPEGYPPVYLTQPFEYEAVMELRTVLLQAFPGDDVLVRVPPTIRPSQKASYTLARR